jgi:hypothetical protein
MSLHKTNTRWLVHRMNHGQLRHIRLTMAHILPPYSTLCGCPWGPHPNGFLSWDSQVGVPKLPKLELPRLWGPIILHVNLLLKWCLKQSCSPYQDLSNGMFHATSMQGNWVDSRLLVVGSQIGNLTLGSSFGHNLCFRYPNGWCKPILNIYVPRAFQWYKELVKPLNFDTWNHPLKIWESTRTPTPKMELPWGVRVHSLTFSHTPESMLCDSRFPFGLQPCNPLPWLQAQG